MSSQWDNRFLELSRHVATWSKDPSTKVGAVIVERGTRRVVSMGYNGFPRGIVDSTERLNDRPTKLALVSHAERNALDQAEQSVRGMSMFVTLFPCSECCKSIIQRGISRVYTCAPTEQQMERWGDSLRLSATLLGEAHIDLHIHPTASGNHDPAAHRLVVDHKNAWL